MQGMHEREREWEDIKREKEIMGLHERERKRD
jgi:hypothetical protein